MEDKMIVKSNKKNKDLFILAMLVVNFITVMLLKQDTIHSVVIFSVFSILQFIFYECLKDDFIKSIVLVIFMFGSIITLINLVFDTPDDYAHFYRTDLVS